MSTWNVTRKASKCAGKEIEGSCSTFISVTWPLSFATSSPLCIYVLGARLSLQELVDVDLVRIRVDAQQRRRYSAPRVLRLVDFIPSFLPYIPQTPDPCEWPIVFESHFSDTADGASSHPCIVNFATTRCVAVAFFGGLSVSTTLVAGGSSPNTNREQWLRTWRLSGNILLVDSPVFFPCVLRIVST